MPQGFPASPIIAELLVAPSLADDGVVYADNVFDAFATLGEIRENDETLVVGLREHPAGRFELKPPNVRRLDWGADVLGIRVAKKRGAVTTAPTKGALAKFEKVTWTEPATRRRAGGKFNLQKLKKRIKGMARSMPLDDERKWWVEVTAEDRLDSLVRQPHDQVRPRSRLARDHDNMEMHCGFRA